MVRVLSGRSESRRQSERRHYPTCSQEQRRPDAGRIFQTWMRKAGAARNPRNKSAPKKKTRWSQTPAPFFPRCLAGGSSMCFDRRRKVGERLAGCRATSGPPPKPLAPESAAALEQGQQLAETPARECQPDGKTEDCRGSSEVHGHAASCINKGTRSSYHPPMKRNLSLPLHGAPGKLERRTDVPQPTLRSIG